jgi:SNF2 family DNA or RNA helicase
MVRIDDGSMSADARENTLQRIKSSKSIHVILISFKAGSTGKQCPLIVMLN